MSTTTLNLTVSTNGLLSDLSSLPVLQDEGGTFGLRRIDTGEVIEASGSAFTRLALGTYQYVVTDPGPSITYEYVLKYVVDGTTYYSTRQAVSTNTVNNVLSIPTGSSHYSSEAEVLRLLGEYAVDAMTEDWEQADASPIWDDILEETDETIDLYIMQHYPAQSYSNVMLRRNATILAANLLCQRRNNPGLHPSRVAAVMEKLEAIRAGKFMVRGLAPIGNVGPVVRNYVMQPIGNFPQRVETMKSTGTSYSGQRDAWMVPYLYQL